MKKLSKTIKVLVGIFAILTLESTHFPSYVAFAQSVRGSLTGSVLDQSGAAIPGAKVTVRDPNTGVTRTTVSSAEGSYSFGQTHG
jgi:hypothetical protein